MDDGVERGRIRGEFIALLDRHDYRYLENICDDKEW